MNGVRVLLSAYACEPDIGSEQTKAWNLAVALARRGLEVTVLTCDTHHRAGIERWLERHGGAPAGLSFAWHEVPGWTGPGYADARGIRRHYLAWQATARAKVRRLHAGRPFDVVHHVSWAVLRWPSFLGGLGPRFVFGPVGGGETAPWRLRRGFSRAGWKSELVRDVANAWSRLDPLVHIALRRADAILVTDPATHRHLPRRLRRKAWLFPVVLAPMAQSEAWTRTSAARDRSGPRLLQVARLESWKGIHLALGALARLRHRHPGATLTLVGVGPDEAHYVAMAKTLGIADAVRFAGRVPHESIGAIYAGHDLFIFPSLHETGGQAVGEALAHGLPVLCLDLGGPGTFIDASCGVRIATAGQSRSTVEQRLADAAAAIVDTPGMLAKLRGGALARAQALQLERQAEALVRRFYLPADLASPPRLEDMIDALKVGPDA